MRIESIDLNLLLALDAIASERHVTRAAEKIGLSQPAMSNALARLRRIFDDPLFERRGGQMRPTARAHQIAVPVAEALSRLREAIEPQRRFVPEESSREFFVVTNDYAEAVLLAPLVREIQRLAPSIALRTIRTSFLFSLPVDRLESGEIDLALGFLGERAAPRHGLLSKSLFEERFVCITRSRHPRVRTRLGLRAFLDIPQVRVLYPGEERIGTIDVTLRGRGLARHVALTIPHLAPIPSIVARTDLLGVVPERLARAEARGKRLRIHPLPIPLASFSVVIAWHERNQFDPAHSWLRDLVARVVT